ncbi:MAG: hypothetical protein OZ921_13740 [Sorangiineae bacterium]|nr:hypothetical protein [Polyangiaceae bacterium]MEB2323569.1 hypothetical protein [Sorangiineae bacterium]
MRHFGRASLASLCLLGATGCLRDRPGPPPAASTAVAAPPPLDSTIIRVELAPEPSARARSTAAPPAGAPAPPASAPPAEPPRPDLAPVAEPRLRGDDGKLLAQTEDEPSSTDPLFVHHARLLYEAIVADDPSIALPFFFPVEAYQVVKDIARPERDWKYRLIRNFERDIHDYHRKLSAGAGPSGFIELAVPAAKATWMKPGSEGNRLGYYRVLRARLRYRDGANEERELPITSLISWRGVWYVVHVNGFK